MSKKDSNIIPVKGGFPRIKIVQQTLETKQEQGFSGIYSLKNMKTSKKEKPLMISTTTDELTIVNNDRTVNGVNIDIFAF